jgi:hypothetical protein
MTSAIGWALVDKPRALFFTMLSAAWALSRVTIAKLAGEGRITGRPDMQPRPRAFVQGYVLSGSQRMRYHERPGNDTG